MPSRRCCGPCNCGPMDLYLIRDGDGVASDIVLVAEVTNLSRIVVDFDGVSYFTEDFDAWFADYVTEDPGGLLDECPALEDYLNVDCCSPWNCTFNMGHATRLLHLANFDIAAAPPIKNDEGDLDGAFGACDYIWEIRRKCVPCDAPYVVTSGLFADLSCPPGVDPAVLLGGPPVIDTYWESFGSHFNSMQVALRKSGEDTYDLYAIIGSRFNRSWVIDVSGDLVLEDWNPFLIALESDIPTEDITGGGFSRTYDIPLPDPSDYINYINPVFYPSIGGRPFVPFAGGYCGGAGETTAQITISFVPSGSAPALECDVFDESIEDETCSTENLDDPPTTNYRRCNCSNLYGTSGSPRLASAPGVFIFGGFEPHECDDFQTYYLTNMNGSWGGVFAVADDAGSSWTGIANLGDQLGGSDDPEVSDPGILIYERRNGLDEVVARVWVWRIAETFTCENDSCGTDNHQSQFVGDGPRWDIQSYNYVNEEWNSFDVFDGFLDNPFGTLQINFPNREFNCSDSICGSMMCDNYDFPVPNVGNCTGGDAEVFTTPGTHEWICPEGVTEVLVKCWGAGGGGGGGLNEGGGRGGGGGGYGELLISVTPSTTYDVVVGQGGDAGTSSTNGGTGQDSYFIGDGAEEARGNGGNGGGRYATGSGGGGSSGTGTTTHTGGSSGGILEAGHPHAGGSGGGQGASETADGVNGANSSGSTGALGGGQGDGPDAGDGGNGGDEDFAGEDGLAPGGGGGGGGAHSADSGGNDGGMGGNGRVEIGDSDEIIDAVTYCAAFPMGEEV